MRGRADESEATKEGRQREVAQRKGERAWDGQSLIQVLFHFSKNFLVKKILLSLILS